MDLTHCWSRVITLAALVLIFLGSAALAPAFADNLNITGGVPGVACGNPSVSSGSLAFSCPPSTISGVLTSSGAGNLSTGVFGAATEVSAVSSTGGSTSADIFVTYNFAVSGVLNGTAQFDFSAPGTISCVECDLFVPESGQAFGFFIDGDGESINGGPLGEATNVPLANGANNFVVDTSVSNGTAELFFGLEIGTACDPSTPIVTVECTAISNFLDPLSITGASVYDANGNLVSDASLVSESGFNPNAAVTVPTPEPSSLGLLGFGLFGLIGLWKRAMA